MNTPNIPLTLNCDALPISASVNDILIKYTSALAEIQRLLAEVERLRSDRDCEKRLRKDADELRENAIARAEKSERAETVAIAHWNGALERAIKAEAEAHQWKASHDNQAKLKSIIMARPDLGDRAPRVEAMMAEVAEANARAERYRLATLKLDAELATERARLDWVFRNCKVEANDFTTGNRDVYAIHDREDLGAAMKEDAT
jgi:hypothetical protein